MLALHLQRGERDSVRKSRPAKLSELSRFFVWGDRQHPARAVSGQSGQFHASSILTTLPNCNLAATLPRLITQFQPRFCRGDLLVRHQLSGLVATDTDVVVATCLKNLSMKSLATNLGNRLFSEALSTQPAKPPLSTTLWFFWCQSN